MRESFERKYRKVLDMLPDAAQCAGDDLILVGGTALALFHLRHRVSVDLDFVARKGDDVAHKERIKGCLSKRGYRTSPGAFKNQFVVQFEDTSIKVEVFCLERELRSERRIFAATELEVAAIDEILKMKEEAYQDRREARDLFDIFCILKDRGTSTERISDLIAGAGGPMNMDDIDAMAMDPGDAVRFKKVVSDAP